MKYHIDKECKKPAYLQLYEQLRRDITDGIYPYAAKLPSKRLLAEECGVSVITTEHTYSILCDEGYLENRPRSGFYVVYKQDDFISAEAPQPVRSPAGNNHSAKWDFPFSVLSKTMRRVLLDYGERILVKSPNHGCPELRAAVAAYLARSSGIAVRPEQIIIGSGAEYLYSLIVQLFDDERIALENPSYDKIRRVYEANGLCCELLKMDSTGIKTEELNRAEAKLLHITPFNSFPSGITATASKRNEYLQWAEQRGGYIIEDNYDSELTVSTKAQDPLFALSDTGRVLYLNTFSRTVAPSVRVGYLVLPEGLLSSFEERLGFYSCTVPVFEQYVLAELLGSGDFERHINRVRRKKRKLVI